MATLSQELIPVEQSTKIPSDLSTRIPMIISPDGDPRINWERDIYHEYNIRAYSVATDDDCRMPATSDEFYAIRACIVNNHCPLGHVPSDKWLDCKTHFARSTGQSSFHYSGEIMDAYEGAKVRRWCEGPIESPFPTVKSLKEDGYMVIEITYLIAQAIHQGHQKIILNYGLDKAMKAQLEVKGYRVSSSGRKTEISW